MDKQTHLVAHYKPRRARAEIDDSMKKFVRLAQALRGGGASPPDPTPSMREVWKGAVVMSSSTATARASATSA